MAENEKNDIASSLKILKAAEEVFAEKGFDGARVDEIAKRAGVNKALIYYYFASKDQILAELSKKHLQEMIDNKKELLNGNNLEQGLTRDAVGKFIELTLSTLSERKNFFQIVLTEALKDTGDASFFDLMNQMYDDGLSRLDHLGYPIEGEKFKTLAVFFGLIPVIFYIAMGEKWAEFNGLDKGKVKAAFFEALVDVEYSLFLDKFKSLFNQETISAFYKDDFNINVHKRAERKTGK